MALSVLQEEKESWSDEDEIFMDQRECIIHVFALNSASKPEGNVYPLRLRFWCNVVLSWQKPFEAGR